MNVLVTGGTGALGKQVVNRLREGGHRARIFSRRAGPGDDWVQGDLATGTGLAQAVAGMESIIHAGSATTRPWKTHVTDVGGTKRLLDAARDAGVHHFVYPSIVGMEGVPYPYFKHKLAAEALVREGGVPWSIVRATQFHTLVETFLGAFSVVPGLVMAPFSWQFQPVDARDVAVRLVEVVTAEPGGTLPDYGGPEVRGFRSLAESWLKVRALRKRLVNIPFPMAFSRKWSEGRLLCPDHREGMITWEQYLERRYGNSR